MPAPSDTYGALVYGTTGITHYWRLNETAGPIVDLIGSVSGTVTGGVTLNQTAIAIGLQPCAVFNGTTGCIALGTVNLGGATGSIEAWVNPSALQTSSPFDSDILGNDFSSADNVILRLGNDLLAGNGLPCIQFGIAGAQQRTFAASSITAGTPIHIVGTYDGAFVTIYINGAASGTPQAATGTWTSNQPTYIGSENGPARFFAGSISDVATYSVALDATTILSHYNAGITLGGPPPQKARPSADVTDGNWLNEAASNTNLYASIDEADTAVDTDYIQSGANPSSDLVEVSLGSISDPVSSSGHILRYRTRLDTVVTGSGAMSLVTELRQGTSALSTPVSDTIAPASTTETTNTVTLSGAQADAITDYTTLRLRSTATQAAPGAPTFVAAGTADSNATGSNIAPGAPAGIATGDILFLVVHVSDNVAPTLSGAGGTWTICTDGTRTLDANNTTAMRATVWWSRFTAAQAMPAVVHAGTICKLARIYAFRGAAATDPPFELVSLLANAASATVSTTNISPTTNNVLGLFFGTYEDDPTTITTVATWTQPAGAVSTTSSGNDAMQFLEYKTFASGGTFGTPSLTVSGGTFANSPNIGMLVALTPVVNNSKARITWAELEVPAAAALAGIVTTYNDRRAGYASGYRY